MTGSTTTGTAGAPGSGGREPAAKPSASRRLASLYLDVLISGFFSWIVCFTFGWQSYWSSTVLILLVAELLWCRERLNPTVGEFCLGIRYLTSSSAHVVADIKVIHPKFKLNDYVLLAGMGEITLAFIFFCGWTFCDKVIVLGYPVGPPFSLVYWILSGLAFFACGASFLSGSKNTVWTVTPLQLLFVINFYLSADAWVKILKTEQDYSPWLSNVLEAFGKVPGSLWFELFCCWSVFTILVVFLSRRHWVN
jgi:hypothetical protein